MTSNRINYMDAIKALAMFLVIWGHCILHLASWDKNDSTAFVVINSFHVSLFMMVAGYFSTSSLSLNFGTLLLKKAKEILIPCLLWGVLMTGLITYFNHSSISHAIVDYFNCLWFLKSLFLCYLLAYITVRLGTIPALMVIAASMVLTVFKMNVMFPAFMLGVFLKKKQIVGTDNGVMRLLWITIPAFIIMAYFYDGHYFNSPNKIVGIIKEASLSTWLAYFGKTAYRILIGNCGALAVLYIFSRFFATMADNTICKVGRETLGIYLIQAIVLETILRQYVTFSGHQALFDFIIAPLLSLIIMAICYYLTRLLDLNKFSRAWLLGRFPKKSAQKKSA